MISWASDSQEILHLIFPYSGKRFGRMWQEPNLTLISAASVFPETRLFNR